MNQPSRDSLPHRRTLIKSGLASAAALAALSGAVGTQCSAAEDLSATNTHTGTDREQLQAAASKIRYCLNTSTIRGQKLGIVREIEIAKNAGYDGIEPWMRDIEKYVQDGGKLSDLKKMLDDAGLQVESAIGFAAWIAEDDQARAAGLKAARHDMEVLRELGGTHIAAPPAGARDKAIDSLFTIAERYRALLELGAEIGVIPQLEVWGFAANLSRLGETVFAAVESGHPDACILPDVYHIYKGGSEFTGLKLLDGSAIHCFHMNDYPVEPGRDTINDADRVYPGDGIAPLNDILQGLLRNGFESVLSLELFNPEYWKQDPATVAATGLKKMKASVQRAVEA